MNNWFLLCKGICRTYQLLHSVDTPCKFLFQSKQKTALFAGQKKGGVMKMVDMVIFQIIASRRAGSNPATSTLSASQIELLRPPVVNHHGSHW